MVVFSVMLSVEESFGLVSLLQDNIQAPANREMKTRCIMLYFLFHYGKIAAAYGRHYS